MWFKWDIAWFEVEIRRWLFLLIGTSKLSIWSCWPFFFCSQDEMRRTFYPLSQIFSCFCLGRTRISCSILWVSNLWVLTFFCPPTSPRTGYPASHFAGTELCRYPFPKKFSSDSVPFKSRYRTHWKPNRVTWLNKQFFISYNPFLK